MYCLQRFKSEIVVNDRKETALQLMMHRLQKCLGMMIWYISKTTTRDYQVHSLLMRISKLLQKKYMDVNQIMINHILNHIKSIKTVGMDIRLSAVMMINTVNQFSCIEEKMPFISSWKIVRRTRMVQNEI